MKNIVIIGFATCYKTTVGRLLATRIGCDCIDTDSEIERIRNKSVQQIFETNGEGYFRQAENELLQQLVKLNKSTCTVVSCGGGTVLSPNFPLLATGNMVVCLTATAETVHSRLDGATRPLFDGLTVDQLQEYLQQRAPLYAKYADITISTDNKTPQQVAEEVYAKLARLV